MIELNKFIEKISDQFVEPDNQNIELDTEYQKLDTWDSLTSMAIIAIIDDEFGVVIAEDDLVNSQTIIELFNLVNRKSR